jgi:hypothetical protein
VALNHRTVRPVEFAVDKGRNLFVGYVLGFDSRFSGMKVGCQQRDSRRRVFVINRVPPAGFANREVIAGG